MQRTQVVGLNDWFIDVCHNDWLFASLFDVYCYDWLIDCC